ncbi:hypothetical protein KNHN1_11530 [Pseudomonas guariconensis]
MQLKIRCKGKHALSIHFMDEVGSIHRDYSGAFSLELPTNRTPNSLSGSGHQSDLAFKSVHQYFSLTGSPLDCREH